MDHNSLQWKAARDTLQSSTIKWHEGRFETVRTVSLVSESSVRGGVASKGSCYRAILEFQVPDRSGMAA